MAAAHTAQAGGGDHSVAEKGPAAGQKVLAPQATPSRETARFIDRDGEQLYCVPHEPLEPNGSIQGRVLLLGPMPSERHYAYASWVEWARYLAGRGFAVVRFDYRASGESTGDFRHIDCGTWLDEHSEDPRKKEEEKKEEKKKDDNGDDTDKNAPQDSDT